ncbi:calcium/sodium antiporter [Faecalimicrobium sp. JNUCC 81]
MPFLFLIIGFMFLIKGADIFVEGAASIAKKFHVPPMVIGLTIVAMGTSAPEAAVSVGSSLAGQNDMSIANVVGSNFFNILIVLGVSSIIAKLPVQEDTIKKDTPFLILVSLILVFLGFNLNLGRIDGLILLIVFAFFLINTVKSGLRSSNNNSIDNNGETAVAIDTSIEESFSMPKTILVCSFGIIGIVLGGDIVVNSATTIATSFGMSQNLVGLTIVAVGTSLPEFVTSIVAIKKGETEIAIGNVIGSNLFNILLVLGLAAVINPITMSTLALIDVIFMTIITVLLYLFMKKNNSLVKKQGVVLVILYIVYMIFTIIR